MCAEVTNMLTLLFLKMHLGPFYRSHVILNLWLPKNGRHTQRLSHNMQAQTAQKVNEINIFKCLYSKQISRADFIIPFFFKSSNNKHIEQDIKTCTCICKQDFSLTNTHKP